MSCWLTTTDLLLRGWRPPVVLTTRGLHSCALAHDEHRVPCVVGDELADDRVPRQLAHDGQAAAGLGVGEQDQLVLVDAGAQVRSHPVEVATAATGDVAGRE